MKIGYARVSTTHQQHSLEAQLEKLETAGCEKIFSEEVSAVSSKRPAFEEAVNFCREGDVFTVCKLDRFARSVSDLSVQSKALQEKGVELQVLDLGLDTSTPTGKLMMNLLGSIAEFERELMLERQKVGIEKAKAAGKFKGRAPTARAKKEQIQKLTAAGLRPSDIAKQLDIGVASVYRYRGVDPLTVGDSD